MTYDEYDALPAPVRSEIGACDDCQFERAGIRLCAHHEHDAAGTEHAAWCAGPGTH
jgi:hypothetical protein